MHTNEQSSTYHNGHTALLRAQTVANFETQQNITTDTQALLRAQTFANLEDRHSKRPYKGPKTTQQTTKNHMATCRKRNTATWQRTHDSKEKMVVPWWHLNEWPLLKSSNVHLLGLHRVKAQLPASETSSHFVTANVNSGTRQN